ncbi:MAG: TetR/AcrR family transcriptional regulator [Actinobacteria bacterium]|nr:TetR/AcrR family transcriptional regulator [Actinomycetota bacterium]
MSSASEAASQRAATGAATPRSSRGHLRPTFEDPLSALPETAQKLLVAAKSIIANDGFDALTLNSVSAASGENKAMISYYFDNKAGLVAAVLDSVIHDEYIASHDRMKDVDPKQRTQRLVEEMRRMDTAIEEFRVFFELLPHVLRDETLRRRIASLYAWYWSVKLEWLGMADPAGALGDPELLGLAQVLSAVIDGLAIQAAIDPEIDLANPYRIFHKMLECSLTALPDGSFAGVGPASGAHSRQ